MRQGKYYVVKGKFVHQDDMGYPNWADLMVGFMMAGLMAYAIWS